MTTTNDLRTAENMYIKGNYPAAFAYFVKYFQNLEDRSATSSGVQNTFTDLVCKIGMVLEAIGDTEELLKVYLQAIDLFPENYIVLSNFGCYMYKICEVNVARTYLEMAVALNNDYLPSKKNLMHCKWQQIPRWHFKMLNDTKRNIAYKKAILNAVNKGFTKIVDLGAGCGLLSLIASQESKSKVTAIEENKLLSTMCENILKANNANNFEVVNCYSTELTQAPNECNCIVTEIFDVALFGERMLESLVHAHNVIITGQPFKIVPERARLFVTGISYKGSQCYRFSISLPELNLDDICIRAENAEPYDAENMALKTFDILTKTEEIFDINFSNVTQLKEMLDNEGFHKFVKLKSIKNGQVEALLCWFELDLDENTTITTNPFDKNCIQCWEQAVFYLPHPISLNHNEEITFKISLGFKILREKQVLDSLLKFSPVSHTENCNKCWLVPKEVISFLNDTKLVSYVTEVGKTFTSEQVLNMTVLDYNIFPLFGLLMAKLGGTTYILNQASGSDYAQFLNHVLSLNEIPNERVIMASDSRPNLGDVPERHLCFHWPIEIDGSLGSHLDNEKYKIIPQTVRLHFQLINSAYLESSNFVKDENVFNFKIASFMNDYSGGEHPNLEILEYIPFSNPLVQEISGTDIDRKFEVTVTQTGEINAVYTWFEVTYEGIVFSTLDSSHFKKCAYNLDFRNVSTGDIIVLHLRVQEPYIDFKAM